MWLNLLFNILLPLLTLVILNRAIYNKLNQVKTLLYLPKGVGAFLGYSSFVYFPDFIVCLFIFLGVQFQPFFLKLPLVLILTVLC